MSGVRVINHAEGTIGDVENSYIPTEEELVEREEARRREKREAKRKLREQKFKKSRRWKIFWILLALLLVGHLIWCLVRHVYATDTCHICGLKVTQCECTIGNDECKVCAKPEQDCTCQAMIQQLMSRVSELESGTTTGEQLQYCSVCGLQENSCYCKVQISELKQEIANLKAQLELAVANTSNDDGLCHSECPIHCKTCAHGSTRVEGYITTIIVGTIDQCNVETYIVRITCNYCGEWLEAEVESILDKDHSFGNDHVCDDCGFDNTPTATATPKPNNNNRPTTTPTTTPTPSVTACPHTHTYEREGNVTWIYVGTEDCCGREERVVSTICGSCGKVLSTTTKVVAVYGDHSFDGRTCTKCNFKRKPGSASATADGTMPPPQNEWYYDDDGEAANPVG